MRLYLFLENQFLVLQKLLLSTLCHTKSIQRKMNRIHKNNERPIGFGEKSEETAKCT